MALLEEIMSDHGVPRNIRSSIEDSVTVLNGHISPEEKIAHLISILDEASSSPNIAFHTRTHIWNIMTNLETIRKG